MDIKMILPALLEAKSPEFRPIKYSLFPPLGLATLAAYCDPDDRITLCDEHVEELNLEDHPDLVVLETYITSAYRAYEIADRYRSNGVRVVMGGLHVTACPEEAQAHADSIFLGPGEDTWPEFLSDLREGRPKPRYFSTNRTLENAPFPRRDLFQKHAYLAPNSIVVSRGCPHQCAFCYKNNFFRGGRTFYTTQIDHALAEIDKLPGRHLFFLDDHLFGHPPFIRGLLNGLRGMSRVWQAASTVRSILEPGLMELAAQSGLRSLFVGFETLSAANLRSQGKLQNINQDYARAIKRLHDLGIMVNASFVFGFDADTPDVFQRTVDWALENGIETATFHILTPYPGTKLYETLSQQGRLLSRDWSRYDTRHAVFQPARMSTATLERGYHQAYREFYRWGAIAKSTRSQPDFFSRMRHLFYTGAWKKAEPIWNVIIRLGLLPKLRPVLETVLNATLRTPQATRKAHSTRELSRG
jgi:radical SAM superfamily enzyme YgiQ (UPF0313 family)